MNFMRTSHTAVARLGVLICSSPAVGAVARAGGVARVEDLASARGDVALSAEVSRTGGGRSSSASTSTSTSSRAAPSP